MAQNWVKILGSRPFFQLCLGVKSRDRLVRLGAVQGPVLASLEFFVFPIRRAAQLLVDGARGFPQSTPQSNYHDFHSPNQLHQTEQRFHLQKL